jgi:hypothetical protein
MIVLLIAAVLTSLSPEQQADFDCLRVGATLQLASHEGGSQPPAWMRPALDRLKRNDPSRDWVAEAKPFGDITYGEFIARANACQRRLRRSR